MLSLKYIGTCLPAEGVNAASLLAPSSIIIIKLREMTMFGSLFLMAVEALALVVCTEVDKVKVISLLIGYFCLQGKNQIFVFLWHFMSFLRLMY